MRHWYNNITKKEFLYNKNMDEELQSSKPLSGYTRRSRFIPPRMLVQEAYTRILKNNRPSNVKASVNVIIKI
jgi:hypothetical protein